MKSPVLNEIFAKFPDFPMPDLLAKPMVFFYAIDTWISLFCLITCCRIYECFSTRPYFPMTKWWNILYPTINRHILWFFFSPTIRNGKLLFHIVEFCLLGLFFCVCVKNDNVSLINNKKYMCLFLQLCNVSYMLCSFCWF